VNLIRFALFQCQKANILHSSKKELFSLFMQIDPNDLCTMQYFLTQACKIGTRYKARRQNENQPAARLDPIKATQEEQRI
jgi:hypothetical protein